MQHRRAGWLVLPLLALAACSGRAATAAPSTGPRPIACRPGEHQSTPEAYYDCTDGAWAPGVAPTTTLVRPTPPGALPLPTPTPPPTTAAPTTVPPTTEAPAPAPA